MEGKGEGGVGNSTLLHADKMQSLVSVEHVGLLSSVISTSLCVNVTVVLHYFSPVFLVFNF